MSRRIATLGNPILRTPPPDVVEFDERLGWRIERMHEILGATGGVGLAAPQIAYFRRVFVYDHAGQRGAICNPVLAHLTEDEELGPEGCLSIPGLTVAIFRTPSVIVRGADANGREREWRAQGMLARIFQHEIDHLAGKLILDRLRGNARAIILGQLRELDIAGATAR